MRLEQQLFKRPKNMVKAYIALTFFIFLIWSFTAGAQAQTPTLAPEETFVDITIEIEDFAPPIRSESQDDKLQVATRDVRLKFAELCKTEEGRQLILNNQDPSEFNDQKFQWEGLRANGQTPERTFDEYRLAALNRRCNQPPDYEFVFGPAQPLGTCQDLKFGPPHYDVKATVQKIRDLVRYYRTSTDPWVGANESEREANLKGQISGILISLEANLQFSYTRTRCKIENTGRCAASTGEKRICEKVYIIAPPYQVIIPESLEGGRHVKEGPVLESPTRAWFKVGKTGSGENWGTAKGESTFDLKGATQKARMDVDAIRRILIERGIPTDKIPSILEEPKRDLSPTSTSPSTPKPRPARVEITRGQRPGNKNYYDVVITNTGGSPAKVYYKIRYYDGFYQSRPPEWKEKVLPFETVEIPAGETRRMEYHYFHALKWEFERVYP